MRAYAGDISRGADMTSRAIAAFNVMAGNSTAAVGGSRSSAGGSGASGGVGIGPQLVDYADDDEDDERSDTVNTKGVLPGPAKMPRRAIDPMMPPVDVLEEEERAKWERMRRRAAGLPPIDPSTTTVVENSMWCEAKSDDGNTYYWNVKTNETVWEKPKEGFMTLKEYNRINQVALRQQELQQQEESMFMRGNADEIVAKYDYSIYLFSLIQFYFKQLDLPARSLKNAVPNRPSRRSRPRWRRSKATPHTKNPAPPLVRSANGKRCKLTT